jgi:hypothetical protein
VQKCVPGSYLLPMWESPQFTAGLSTSACGMTIGSNRCGRDALTAAATCDERHGQSRRQRHGCCAVVRRARDDGPVSQDFDAVTRAWRDAAEDLGIFVVAPYELVDKSGVVAALAVAWIGSFGSPQGIVVADLQSDRDAVRSAARRHGQVCSFLNAKSYGRYDRELFRATLDDWGWYGDPAGSPEWYTGNSWTE